MGNDAVAGGALIALGHAGSGSYAGLEIIELDEKMTSVSFFSDEFTAVCPVTGQPDQYELTIQLDNTQISIESKSLKLYLGTFRNQGGFCENLGIKIKSDIFDAIRQAGKEVGGPFFQDTQLSVMISQKSRGGISIEATA